MEDFFSNAKRTRTSIDTHSSQKPALSLPAPTLQQCPAGQHTNNDITTPGHVTTYIDEITTNIQNEEILNTGTWIFKCQYCQFKRRMAQFDKEVIQSRKDERQGPQDASSKQVRLLLRESIEKDEREAHENYLKRKGPTECQCPKQTPAQPSSSSTTTIATASNSAGHQAPTTTRSQTDNTTSTRPTQPQAQAHLTDPPTDPTTLTQTIPTTLTLSDHSQHDTADDSAKRARIGPYHC